MVCLKLESLLIDSIGGYFVVFSAREVFLKTSCRVASIQQQFFSRLPKCPLKFHGINVLFFSGDFVRVQVEESVTFSHAFVVEIVLNNFLLN